MASCSMRGSLATRHRDRKSTRLNSSHANISYAVFCLKKKKSHDRPGYGSNLLTLRLGMDVRVGAFRSGPMAKVISHGIWAPAHILPVSTELRVRVRVI